MTIPELTSRLNLLDVAPHLGIEARRPFHADQTPRDAAAAKIHLSIPDEHHNGLNG